VQKNLTFGKEVFHLAGFVIHDAKGGKTTTQLLIEYK